jgi:hypothetical protein
MRWAPIIGGGIVGAGIAVALRLVGFNPHKAAYGMESMLSFHDWSPGHKSEARRFKNVLAHEEGTGDWHRLRGIKLNGEQAYVLLAEPGSYTIMAAGETLAVVFVERGKNSAPRNVPADSAWYGGR